MWLGLGSSVVLGAGVRLVYGEKANVAALATILTGVGMFALFEGMLRKKEAEGLTESEEVYLPEGTYLVEGTSLEEGWAWQEVVEA